MTLERQSTLAYPSVHLGSFEGYNSQHETGTLLPLPSPTSPFGPLSHASALDQAVLAAPRATTPRAPTPPMPVDIPTVRDSPSMARRRTVLPASPHAARVPSGRATRYDSDEESPAKNLFPDPRTKRSLPQPPYSHADRPSSHAANKSASSIPIVGGLADAGPYPPQPTIGLGRPTTRPPPQEEVCIECMMRDRDLADVDVQSSGAWARASDAAWEDMKHREELVLDAPNADWFIADLGWRGFKWEDEGLPPGFRGTRGGPLTEQAIKAVMQQFPSASAHRAKYMEHYLYHQAMLIRELRVEAARLGRYPEPGEVPSLRPDGQSIIAGPRTSSVAWYKPDPLEPKIRPSPSSPADLARSRPSVQFARPERKSSGSLWAEEWPPSPESGLRPFSFAVRAGAARGSSDGHGKRNILGRWGGSVTSFFGGSQGGSGSMMDMHLGLDHDRQRRTSSTYVHPAPRAVSLASPTRPSFFSRDSQLSELGDQRVASTSTSRLSQDDGRRKGLKGLLSKMRPKKEPSSSGSQSTSPDSAHRQYESDDRRMEVLRDRRQTAYSSSSLMPEPEYAPNRFKTLPPLPDVRSRASFDPLGGSRRETPSPRLAQSMYIQPSGYAWPEGQDKKKKGLRSFFGGAKAGRVS